MALSDKLKLKNPIAAAAYFAISWISLAITLKLKLGSATDKLYAEDGGIYIQQAIDFPFPRDVFEPYAGYSDVTARIAANFVTLFPINLYTTVILALVSLVLALIGFIVFSSSQGEVKNPILRVLLAIGLILLPIGNFESIGNITNLHFYLMSGCLFLLLGKDLPNKKFFVGSIFIIISCLSTPLMIYYLPIIVIQKFLHYRHKIPISFNPYQISLLIGVILQMLFVFTLAYGDRNASSNHNLLKTIYLFMDRVIGSAIIPFWGYVSTSDSIQNTQVLIFRAGVVTFISLVSLFFFNYWYRSHSVDLVFPLSLLIGLLFYWFSIGYFFAPEPRYAIFAGYMLVCAVISTMGTVFARKGSRTAISLIITISLSTWVGSFTPSALRTFGPTVMEQITPASTKCDSQNKQVRIRLLPLNGNWELIVSCGKLERSKT